MIKHKKRCTIYRFLFCCMIIMLTTVGCSQKAVEEKANNDGYPLIITDDAKREVILLKEPKRIVSLSPSNTEIVFAIGKGDDLVGVTDYCDYPEDANKIEKIGGFSQPNIEKIIALKPDVVLASGIHADYIKTLDRLNVPVIILDPKSIRDVPGNIELLGMALNEEVNAHKTADDMRKTINVITSKTQSLSEEKKPRVYYELWHEPYTTAGPGTFVNDIIELAGGRNIAADASTEYPQYSLESIIEKDPEIIIFSHHYSSHYRASDFMIRVNWQAISAVAHGKIYEVDPNHVQRATPRLILGLKKFAEIIHPEIFK